MNAPENLPPEPRRPITGYMWGVLAGMTAGAFLGEHWGVAALALTALFVLVVARLLRAFKEKS